MSEKGAKSRRVAAIAARQHGVIASAQLYGAGIDAHAVTYRVQAGELHRLHRGVNAVGHPVVSFEGRCLAALLACGPYDPSRREGAVISHRSAAELWGFMPPAKGPIHVTLPTSGGRKRREGLIVHRSRTLGTGSAAFSAGVRVTTPRRTLADLRRTLDAESHCRATRKAVDLRLVDPNGAPDPDLTRSELERRFLALCRRHRLPRPEVNSHVGRYEVDFLWRGERLVVELDGFEFHRSREAFERDRARDADLQRRGFRVLRFTYRQVNGSRRRVARTVREILDEAGR